MKGGIRALAALLFAISVLGCGDETSTPQGEPTAPHDAVVPDSMTIPRMLETDDRFSTLRAALDSTGLDSLLATDGPFTLFAPPNAAFEALPPGTMDVLLSEESERLRTMMSLHVVKGRVSTEKWSTSRMVTALSGDTLSLRRTQDGFSVREVSVADGNIEASNGLLHVIDGVLSPPPEPDTP